MENLGKSYEKCYKEHEIIGFNNKFASVVLVENLENHLYFIAKKIHIISLPSKEQDSALQELSILKNLKHPNIVGYHDSFLEGEFLIIIMEYCEEGDLNYQIQKRSKHKTFFPEKTILNWFLQLTMALEYIHKNNIIHRDIKSSNIFLTSCGSVKIGDFGIAKILSTDINAANTLVGTPNYMSPEVCEQKPYTNKSDIWALGCVIYELCALKLPFQANNLMELLVKITKEDIEPIPKSFNKELFKLLKMLLSKDEAKRPSCQEILVKPMLIKVMQEFITRDSKGLLEKKVPIKQYSIHNQLKKKSPQKIIHEKDKKNQKTNEKKSSVRKGSNFEPNNKGMRGIKDLKAYNPISPLKGKGIKSPQNQQKTTNLNTKSTQKDGKGNVKQKSMFSNKNPTKIPSKNQKLSPNKNTSKNKNKDPVVINQIKEDSNNYASPQKKDKMINSFLMNTEISLNISLTQDSAFYIPDNSTITQNSIPNDNNITERPSANGDDGFIKIEDNKDNKENSTEETKMQEEDIFAGIETRDDDEDSCEEYKEDFEDDTENDLGRLTANKAKQTLDDLLDLYKSQLVESQKINGQSIYEGNLKVIEEELVEMSSLEMGNKKIEETTV